MPNSSGDTAQPGYLGIVLHTRAGLAFVKRLVAGWPGEQAGLKPGDQLISVDGIPAQAPELKSALDRLSGPSGTTVELRVLRSGEPAPLTLRAMRTRSVPPVFTPVQQHSSTLQWREQLSTALDLVAKGDSGALTVLLERYFRERAFDYPTLALESVQKLSSLEGDFAVNVALNEAKSCAMRFPVAAECTEAVRLAFPEIDPTGTLATFALQMHKGLAARRNQFLAQEFESALKRWKRLELLGRHRTGRSPLALLRLKSKLDFKKIEIQAMSLDGEPIWQAPATPDEISQSVLEALQLRSSVAATEEILERVLSLAEPSWIWPHFFSLDSSTQADLRGVFFEPRWSLESKSILKKGFTDARGTPIAVERELQSRPGVLLYCSNGVQSCEDWRLHLAAAMTEQPELNVFAAMVFTSTPKTADSAFSWPVWYHSDVGFETPAVQVVGADGSILESYKSWAHGLEYRILWQLQLLSRQEVVAERSAVTGGTRLNSWELRWIQNVSSTSAASWSRPVHASKRLWISTPNGRMEVMEDGQIRSIIDALGPVVGLWVTEIDGDSREELLVYHSRDKMLEALDTSGATRWIRMEDNGIEELLVYDSDSDGIDEFLVRGADGVKLYNIRADGTLAWSIQVQNPILGLSAGQQSDGRSVIAILQPGLLTLVDQGGMKLRELRVASSVRLAELVDLDGNGESEVVLGTTAAKDISGLDLDGDGKRELAVLGPGQQVLIYRYDGRLLSRLSWADTLHRLDHADMDGDGREELTLHGSRLRAIVEWQAENLL